MRPESLRLRWLGRVGALCTLFLSIVGSVAMAQQPLTKATVALGGDGLQYSIHHLAKNGGFYAAEGLDVDAVDVGSGPRQAAALMGGSSEFTTLGFIHVLKSIAEGGSLVAISQGLSILDMQLVLSNEAMQKSGITPDMPIDEKVKRLKGLRIAITSPGSTTDTWLRSLLQKRGLDPDTTLKIQPIAGGNPMLAAMEKKATDGFVWGAPQTETAVAEGLGKIAIDPFKGEIPEIEGVPYIVIITSRDTLKKKPELIRAAVRAVTKAMAFAQEKPQEAGKLVHKDFPEITDQIFDAVWANYLKGMPKTPQITQEQFERTQAWLNITRADPIKLTFDEVVADGNARQATADILAK